MKKENIIEEIEIEFEFLTKIVNEINSIKTSVSFEGEPAMTIKAAAGTYMMNFYNGIENLLKRIHKLQNVTMPKGDNWHSELFKRFCDPPFNNLPLLFDDDLEKELLQYKKFRHLFIHGYGFQLEWMLMKDGINNMSGVFERIKSNINTFLSIQN